MNILVTGCAGFIGFHLCNKLISDKKNKIIGIDNINNYYDVELKKDRLKILKKNSINFKFFKISIENKNSLIKVFKKFKIDVVINLAAQAGVRYSINFPEVYVKSNIIGFFNILNLSKNYKVTHFIYASTSSVYGDSKKFPNKELDETSSPLSFYAATKKSNEVMANSFSEIYNIKTTGIRFFTVYGPFGRPDMALFKFTKSIIENKEITLFNNGKHTRDFTYVDDVVDGIILLINSKKRRNLSEIYNLGSSNPKKLMYFLKIIENRLKTKAKKKYIKLQKGDVEKTFASTNKIKKLTGFKSKVNIKDGIYHFIDWYKKYYNV